MLVFIVVVSLAFLEGTKAAPSLANDRTNVTHRGEYWSLRTLISLISLIFCYLSYQHKRTSLPSVFIECCFWWKIISLRSKESRDECENTRLVRSVKVKAISMNKIKHDWTRCVLQRCIRVALRDWQRRPCRTWTTSRCWRTGRRITIREDILV